MVKQEVELTSVDETRPEAAQKSVPWMIGVGSFLFVLLQSACSAFIAVSGLRLVIGLGSLAAAASGLKLLDAIHGNAIRIPMMTLAIAGTVVNLYVIWQRRSLRARPASQWRMSPVSPEQRRAENIQIVIGVMTLLLVLAESIAHLRLQGTL